MHQAKANVEKRNCEHGTHPKRSPRNGKGTESVVAAGIVDVILRTNRSPARWPGCGGNGAGTADSASPRRMLRLENPAEVQVDHVEARRAGGVVEVHPLAGVTQPKEGVVAVEGRISLFMNCMMIIHAMNSQTMGPGWTPKQSKFLPIAKRRWEWCRPRGGSSHSSHLALDRAQSPS
jgi:hypothetical protein